MKKFYSNEKNVQVLIAIIKANNIRKVIASPGTTNMALVGSLQQDSYFEMYSCADERSAAYMACGLAAESGEPVILTCTGATASRNYIPGLTEAYYRKLPVLAITSTQIVSKAEHLIAQVIDRSSIQNDIANLSVTLPVVKDDDDLWDCEIKVNRAILELKHHGGGPVHINLPTLYSKNYDVKELPQFRIINRIMPYDVFPELPEGKIAVFVGSHKKWSIEETDALDKFCETNNAVVFCDHTSNYKGKYRVLFAIAADQEMFDRSEFLPDLFIHIGEVSGDYYTPKINTNEIWRISEDGEIRDTYKKLRYVFECREIDFFKYYTKDKTIKNTYLEVCMKKLQDLYQQLPELPFSNMWIASQLADKMPENSTIHFGILNSLRSWNFFEIHNSIQTSSNVGGFGIDGGLSSLIGASLTDINRLYFGIIGDLAFFYDMNVIGNRHVGKNLRILLVNNGKGTEFRQFNHLAAQFGEEADKYMAAAGHFGNKSDKLIKHYASDLGFKYLSASDKKEFDTVYNEFLDPTIGDKPILFEVFTTNNDESDAFQKIINIDKNLKGRTKLVAKQILGEKGIDLLKKIKK